MHPVHTARSGQDAPSPFTIPADARGALAAARKREGRVPPRMCASSHPSLQQVNTLQRI